MTDTPKSFLLNCQMGRDQILGIICFPRDEKLSSERQRGKTVRRGETQISEECAEFGLKAFFFSYQTFNPTKRQECQGH